MSISKLAEPSPKQKAAWSANALTSVKPVLLQVAH